MGCDSNSHHTVWGSTGINKRGESLLEYIVSNNLDVLNVGSVPTFVTSNREEVIDITLASSDVRDQVTGWQVLDEVSFSDHRYIVFQFSDVEQPIEFYRNPKKTNWEIFEQGVKDSYSSVESLDTIESLEKAVYSVTDSLVSNFQKSCPERRKFDNIRTPWWNKTLTKLRKQARRAFRNSRTDANSAEEYKTTQKLFKKESRKAKRKSWREYCESISSLSEAARLQKVINKDRSCSLGMLRTRNDVYTNNPEELLDTLLETHFPDCTSIPDSCVSFSTGFNCIRSEPDWNSADRIVDVNKVKWAVNDLEPYKSAGMDGIFPALIQHALQFIITDISHIFRASIAFGYIPESWRSVKVVFIPKAGKDSYDLAKSFRPISLTSHLLKVLEKLVHQYFRETTLISEPFHRHQFAYQEGKSTITALQQFVDRIEATFENKGFALAVFMDIEGAFDNVPFTTLLNVLLKRNIPRSVCNLIECMLKTRTMVTESNDTTRRALAGRGCPQGGVLSPLLWNLVVDELLKVFERHSAYAFAYADDVTSLTTGKYLDIVTVNMQRNLNLMEGWCLEAGLRVNPAKTTAVLFTRNRVKKLGSLKIFQKMINYSESIKLLGVTLDSKLLFKEHCQVICKKATASLMQCKRTVGKTFGLSPKVMLWIYTLIIRPIFSYSVLLWWNRLSINYIKQQLSSVQRLALLCTTGAQQTCSTAALETLLCLPPLDIYLRGQALMWCQRLKRNGTWSSFSKQGHVKISESVPTDNILDCPFDISRKAFFFEKHYTATVEDFTGNNHEASAIECYTDGSQISGVSGAGMFIKQLGLSKYWNLGKMCTVFQAEMYAIIMAVKYLLDLDIKDTSICIFSDSQASIKSLLKVCSISSIVQQCICLLNDLGKNNRVTVRWVKGHSSCIGNELSDRLARKAAAKTFQGPEPVLPILNCTWKQVVNKWVFDQHTLRWHEDRVGATTKKFDRVPNAKEAKQLVNMNRSSLKVTIDILTGHCTLQKHLYTMKIVDSPLCPSCGEEEVEDVEHFVCKCEAFCEVRNSIFGKPYLDNLTKMVSSTLLSYIKATERFV